MSTASHKAYMLRCIAQEPRHLQWLTHKRPGMGGMPYQSMLVAEIASRLTAAGWIVTDADGRLCITRAGRAEVNKPTSIATLPTLCNASMTERYRGPAWSSVRAGADDHKQHRSLPMGVGA
jgi:hypothetical protein